MQTQQLMNHQRDAIELYKTNINNGIKGVYVFHDVGTGKTRTSIEIMNYSFQKNLIKRAIIVTVTSVVSQFRNQVTLYGTQTDRKNITIISYHKFAKMKYTNPKDYMLIIDEAHRIRNDGIISKRILDFATKVHSVVFLSATPLVNSPYDIVKPVNILKQKYELPNELSEFDKKFISATGKPQNTEEFKEAVKDIFSINIKTNTNKYNRDNSYAKITMIEKPVKMVEQQLRLYLSIQDEMLSNTNMKLLNLPKHIIPKQLNSFLSQTRQLSNVIKGNMSIMTNKMKELSTHLINNAKTQKTIVYSNFISAGLQPLVKLINKTNHDLNIELFTGKQSNALKREIVRQYNLDEINVLCISSAGAEGLDLKGTREIHIMEPHWNQMRIDQVIGRGWRKNAHKNVANKTLKVYQWICKNKGIISADEYLLKLTQRKDLLNIKFIKLLG